MSEAPFNENWCGAEDAARDLARFIEHQAMRIGALQREKAETEAELFILGNENEAARKIAQDQRRRIEELEREKLLWLRTAVNLANDVCCGDQRASGHMLDEYKERVTKALEGE